MRTAQVFLLSLALIVSTGLAGAAYVLANRYEMIAMPGGNNVAWKIDHLTGQAYGCEESEFGPFCIPAPNQIKHSEAGGSGVPGPTP